MSEEEINGEPVPLPKSEAKEAHAYTDGASTGSRGPGGYGRYLPGARLNRTL